MSTPELPPGWDDESDVPEGPSAVRRSLNDSTITPRDKTPAVMFGHETPCGEVVGPDESADGLAGGSDRGGDHENPIAHSAADGAIGSAPPKPAGSGRPKDGIYVAGSSPVPGTPKPAGAGSGSAGGNAPGGSGGWAGEKPPGSGTPFGRGASIPGGSNRMPPITPGGQTPGGQTPGGGPQSVLESCAAESIRRIPSNVDELRTLLVEKGILTQEDWDQFFPLLNGTSVPDLLQQLSDIPAPWSESLDERIPLVTPFQVQEILTGRGETLRFHSYLLLDQLGSGGMGSVFRARHLRGGFKAKLVALKILSRGEMPEKAYKKLVKLFYQESDLVASLNHQAITQVTDRDEIGGIHFFVMEYLKGETLDKYVERMKEGSRLVEWQWVVKTIKFIAEALIPVHAKNIIHRDIKPNNVMLLSGTYLKLLDLGIARISEPVRQTMSASMSSSQFQVIGTPAFMPPEQWKDADSVTPASDIYSLGCLAFYLLTGNVPFPKTSHYAMMHAHCHEPAPTVDRYRSDVPAHLVQVIDRTLQKSPAARYQSCQELVDDLVPLYSDTGTIQITPQGPVAVVPPPKPSEEVKDQQKSRPKRSTTTRRRRIDQRPASPGYLPWIIAVVAGVLLVAGILALAVSRPEEGKKSDEQSIVDKSVPPVVPPPPPPPAWQESIANARHALEDQNWDAALRHVLKAKKFQSRPQDYRPILFVAALQTTLTPDDRKAIIWEVDQTLDADPNADDNLRALARKVAKKLLWADEEKPEREKLSPVEFIKRVEVYGKYVAEDARSGLASECLERVGAFLSTETPKSVIEEQEKLNELCKLAKGIAPTKDAECSQLTQKIQDRTSTEYTREVSIETLSRDIERYRNLLNEQGEKGAASLRGTIVGVIQSELAKIWDKTPGEKKRFESLIQKAQALDSREMEKWSKDQADKTRSHFWLHARTSGALDELRDAKVKFKLLSTEPDYVGTLNEAIESLQTKNWTVAKAKLSAALDSIPSEQRERELVEALAKWADAEIAANEKRWLDAANAFVDAAKLKDAWWQKTAEDRADQCLLQNLDDAVGTGRIDDIRSASTEALRLRSNLKSQVNDRAKKWLEESDRLTRDNQFANARKSIDLAVALDSDLNVGDRRSELDRLEKEEDERRVKEEADRRRAENKRAIEFKSQSLRSKLTSAGELINTDPSKAITDLNDAWRDALNSELPDTEKESLKSDYESKLKSAYANLVRLEVDKGGEKAIDSALRLYKEAVEAVPAFGHQSFDSVEESLGALKADDLEDVNQLRPIAEQFDKLNVPNSMIGPIAGMRATVIWIRIGELRHGDGDWMTSKMQGLKDRDERLRYTNQLITDLDKARTSLGPECKLWAENERKNKLYRVLFDLEAIYFITAPASIRERHVNEAKEIADEIMRLYPKLPMGKFFRGFSEGMRGNEEAARKDLAEAIPAWRARNPNLRDFEKWLLQAGEELSDGRRSWKDFRERDYE